jgi:penicillin-binding protein 1A
MSRLARQRRQRHARGGPAKIFFLSLGVLAGALVVGALVAVGYVISIADSAPDINSLRPVIAGATSQVFAADGTRLGFIESDELRSPVTWNQIPTDLKNATVSIEDQRFYKHNGVDITGIIRSAFKDISRGSPLQGGSTITMQLIRNLYLGDQRTQRTLKRKIIEAKLAMDFEKKHDKQYILTRYLNSVPYGTVGGQTAIGVQAAARIFFNKPASALTLPEAALLAGLPQAPSEYNPFLNAATAAGRRNEVLGKMAQLHYITPEQAAQAESAPLGVKHGTYYTARRENYFFDYIQQQLIDQYGLNTVRQGGLKIYTTINLAYQNEARSAMANVLNLKGDPSSAVVSIDPSDGYIRAMAESQSYGQSKFNLASQGHRQPGSTFKMFVLVTALKQGVDPDNTYYNSQELLPGWLPSNPTYHVQTFGHDYAGNINITQATLKSDNTVYAQLDADVGPDNVKQTAQEMGVTTHLNGYPAEGLGGLTLGVSPLEMADAYATLADGGWRNTPIAITKVAFPDGHVDAHWGQPHRVKVLDDAITAKVTDILHQNMLSGTAVNANINCPAAAKTGTTDNFTDAWLDGFTPKLSTVVWVGYPNAKVPMLNVHGIQVQGGSLPAMIWHDYMSQAIGNNCQNFAPPSHQISYQPFAGKYATSGVRGQFVGSQGGGSATSPSFSTPTHPKSNGNGGNGGGSGSSGGTLGSGGNGGTTPPAATTPAAPPPGPGASGGGPSTGAGGGNSGPGAAAGGAAGPGGGTPGSP